jgi:hypothetical protein
MFTWLKNLFAKKDEKDNRIHADSPVVASNAYLRRDPDLGREEIVEEPTGGDEEDDEEEAGEVEMTSPPWREEGSNVFFNCGLVFHRLFAASYKHMTYVAAKRKLRKYKYPRSCVREIMHYLVEKKYVGKRL